MNQINYHLIDEEEKRQLEQEFNTKQQILMCPFVIVDGVDDITQGVYTSDPDRFKSASFDRVFQGRNPVIALWKNSTKSINQKTEGGLNDFNKPAYKEFSVGESFPVILDENGETYFQSFTDDVNGNKRFSTNANVSIKLPFELDRSYWYDWMLFPELGEEFYYIESIAIYRDKDETFAYTEVTLKKVNDELELVTTNADSLILRSSPGEEYAWPKVVEPEDKRQMWKNLELDEEKLIPKGVKYLQLTSTEPMLLGSFYAWGRRIETTDEGLRLITETRHLLPSQMKPSTADPILGINAPSDKFFWMEQGQITVGKEYGSWFSQFKEGVMSFFGWDNNNQHKNYGAIKFEDIETALESAPNKTKTDLGGNTITVPQTYWDDWEIKAVADVGYDGRVGYKTFTPYSEERFPNNKALLHDKLARNVFILGNLVQLPMEYEAKVPFGTVNVVVGGIRKLILGKDAQYLTNNSNRDNYVDIPLLGEHSYISAIANGLMSADTETDAKKYMPLQLFSGDRPEILSGKNVNTMSVKIELSDVVDIDGESVNTTELGVLDQNYFTGSTTVSKTTSSYILDRIIIQAICLGDIKITAFDSLDQPIGSMMFNTNSKRTGSILDWTTEIKTSEWESDETVETTPNVPNPSNAGPDDTVIPDFEVTKTISNPRSISESWVAEVNWFEKFKEINPEYEGTLEDFLSTHKLSCGIQSTSEVTTTVQERNVANVPTNYNHTKTVATNVVDYNPGLPLSSEGITDNIKFTKNSDTWYLTDKSVMSAGNSSWNSRDKVITSTGVNETTLDLNTGIMSFNAATKFTPTYSTYSDKVGINRAEIAYDHTSTRFNDVYLTMTSVDDAYRYNGELVYVRSLGYNVSDSWDAIHSVTNAKLKFTNIKITRI